ncbi:nuclear speckle splicing regulatory protein 1 [Aplysia californica]|uniref:Nuclear speckle splicing regulatory protein 1 n=1 Tax=Aplysia californica TaxID=6500 RepID=A0ABM0JEY1_APLCA|nr:nuclear speckle splicing regulatory protein 1 [Aplysia californica]
MSQNKVYGLILPKKNTQGKGSKPTTTSFNVFGDESDEEETTQVPVAPYGQGKSSSSSKMKRQTQMDIDKALQEDPSVYEYDEIYDDMQAQKPKVGAKEKESNTSTKDRKPKYIAGLLKAAEVKKREEERRKERQVQKEREAEGAKYADKESFVTSAYKKKMLEMQAEEERERQEAAMEAMTDVTKQKDMSGFYRYLYRQTTGGKVKPEPQVKEEKDENRQNDSIKEEPTETPETQARVKEEPQSPTAAERRSRSASSSSQSGSSESDSEQPKTSGRKEDKVQFSKRSKVQAASQFRKKRADLSPGSDTSPQRQKENSPRTRRHSPDATQGQSKSGGRRKRSRSRSRSNSPPAPRKSLKSSSENRRRNRSRSPEREKSQSVSGERHSYDTQTQSRSSKGDESGSHRGLKSNTGESDMVTSPGSDNSPRARSEEVNDSIVDNLKEMRKQTAAVIGPKRGKENSTPSVDPAKKVYPHHNSVKDIEEARKRYLQRKIARERARMA